MKTIRSGSLGELDAMTRSEFRSLNPCKRYQMLNLAMRYKPYQEENFSQRDRIKEKTGKRADFYLYCMRYSFFSNYGQALKDAIFGAQAMVQQYPCIFTDAESRRFVAFAGSVKHDGRPVQATAFIDPEWGFEAGNIKYIHVTPITSCSMGEHILVASRSLADYHLHLATLLSGAYGHQAVEEPDARKVQADTDLGEFMKNNSIIRGGLVSLGKNIKAVGQSDKFGAGDKELVGAILNKLFSSHMQKIAGICKENGWTDLMHLMNLD